MEKKDALIDYQKGYISLPFEGENFKEFVVKLLGKPQEISRDLAGCFEVSKKDIINVCELLNQRIERQNTGKLVQFSSTIYFSDDKSVTLGSFDEFVTYNEIKPIACHGISISLIYLILFPLKSAPEKQEITITFLAPPTYYSFGDSYFSYLLSKLKTGTIQINIKHTERSWGADIEFLLTDFLKRFLADTRTLSSWVTKYKEILGIGFGILNLLCILYASDSTNNVSLTETRHSKIAEFEKITVLEEKLNYLIRYLVDIHFGDENSVLGFVYMILGMGFCIVSGFLVYYFGDFTKPSFVLLSDETIRMKEKSLQIIKRNWYKFLASLILPLIIGYLCAKFVF